MVSNNQYYKAIAELLNDTEYTGEHNDGYYLKRIVEHYGVSYSKVKCKGKYLKDWARAILGTVTGSHANNYYLKNIAEALTSEEYSWRSENRYLKIILNNISAPSLVVSSDKSILSYADSESATLTATLRSGDNVGKTITFYNVTDDIELGTGVTDSDGVAQCNQLYSSQGIGDVEFEASYGSLVSKTCSIKDVRYYNDGTHVRNVSIDSGATFSTNGAYITATSSSGEKYAKINIGASGNWEFSFEIAETGTNGDFQWQINNSSIYGATGYAKIGGQYYYFTAPSPMKGKRVAIRYQNGVLGVYIDDTLMTSASASITLTNFGWYMNSGRTQYYKNIMFKPL